MPRWASRITLTVTDVRVQRVQDISEQDVLAEGVDWKDAWEDAFVVSNIKDAYRDLWNSINGKKHPWESNPWVAAYTFTVRLGNIDQVAA